jgi:hypothetical protein
VFVRRGIRCKGKRRVLREERGERRAVIGERRDERAERGVFLLASRR